MKVYVVEMEYEGGQPIGVYSTEAMAKDAAEKYTREHEPFGEVVWYEVEVDAMPEPPETTP